MWTRPAPRTAPPGTRGARPVSQRWAAHGRRSAPGRARYRPSARPQDPVLACRWLGPAARDWSDARLASADRHDARPAPTSHSRVAVAGDAYPRRSPRTRSARRIRSRSEKVLRSHMTGAAEVRNRRSGSRSGMRNCRTGHGHHATRAKRVCPAATRAISPIGCPAGCCVGGPPPDRRLPA